MRQQPQLGLESVARATTASVAGRLGRIEDVVPMIEFHSNECARALASLRTKVTPMFDALGMAWKQQFANDSFSPG